MLLTTLIMLQILYTNIYCCY